MTLKWKSYDNKIIKNSKRTTKVPKKVLPAIVNAPWNIRNDNLDKDLKMETANRVIKKYIQKHEQRLQKNINMEFL